MVDCYYDRRVFLMKNVNINNLCEIFNNSDIYFEI